MSDPAEKSWNERVAGDGVPLWGELDEATKKRWRSSLTASGYAFHTALGDVLDPIVEAAEKLFRRPTRSNSETGDADGD